MRAAHRPPVRTTCSLVLPLAIVASAVAAPPAWTGHGNCRVLVKVDPVDLKDRRSDELPARHAIDLSAIPAQAGSGGYVDLASLQVHKYDPQTGQAEPFKEFDNARSPFDRPCRFEDRAVPDDYPDRASYSSDFPTGRGPVIVRKGGGRLFNREMASGPGRVVWVHTQTESQPSYYAIYWNRVPNAEQAGPPPAPWIGDADVLRREKGQSLGGFSHFTATAADFNGDGLFDLFAGVEKGDVMWFPNRGTPGHPRFVGCRMLMDEEGPIDCGWYAAPFTYDWDNDGLPDLLVGTSHNVILWWKNTGTRTDPKLSYRGFVQANGQRLEVPESPVPEDTATIFARDYFNQPWVGDWNGDGLPDILTGGYTTGLIFYYRGTGRDAAGVPTLQYEGPLQSGGKPIDTVWAAAPAAADFNADGRMDLVTGSWFWSGIARQPAPGEADFLMYYQGGDKPGLLEHRPLPKTGDFPGGTIARPTVVDWNSDGLPDLLVSDGGGSVYVFLNVSTRTEPRWQMDSRALTIPWGFVREFAFSGSLDRKGERPLLISADILATFTGSAYSPHMQRLGRATVKGKSIDYPGPGYGDPYYYTALGDWNRDGRVDLFWGTHQGEIYLHHPAEGTKDFAFEPGKRLTLKDGKPLRVGPEVVDSPKKATDFTILQGSRVIMTPGDLDGDGIDDLAVTETYGNLWVFRNTRRGATDAFEPGVLVGKVIGGGRSDDLSLVDWNQDGLQDLIIGQTAAKPGTIYINHSKPGSLAFDKPIQPLDLPFLFWGANFHAMDWNGDGDRDFIIQSEFFTFWAEGSFIRHGCREAVALGPAEAAPPEGNRK